jgi:DNA modification methylase
MTVQILTGDCRDVLPTLLDRSVHCVVTSPPYFGLRDYGHDGQIGLESSPDEYVAEMVGVFREVRRVLRDDGTLWLNIGDSYASGGMSNPSVASTLSGGKDRGAADYSIQRRVPTGMKPKDLVGIPWLLAFALRADGWYLRQDIIWAKPNPMPESVRDRCTKAHEYVFLMSKSERYWFDADAIAEQATGAAPGNSQPTKGGRAYDDGASEHRTAANLHAIGPRETRNKRSVWSIASKPFAEAHFATMPPALAESCVLAGCPEGGTVLDPFGGAGTTGLVADRLQRNAILIEINPDYAAMANSRVRDESPLFAEVS